MNKLIIILILIINSMMAKEFEKLLQGNENFLENSSLQQLRKKNIDQQNPIAAVLTCADSRVSPEIIFDKSLGELFVIRNAGNVIDDVVIASIEFAVEHLKVPLIIVMGHQNCGAVQGTLDVTFKGTKASPKSLNEIFKKIQPSFEGIDSANQLVKAIIKNAIYQKNQLINKSAIVRSKLRESKIQLLTLYYNMETGKVEIVEK